MTAPLPFDTSPQRVKLTAKEFWLLADAGAFRDFVKTELIEGEIFVVNSVHSRHARAHAALTGEFYLALRDTGSDLVLLSTPSTDLSDDSVPEPDISLARKAEGKAVSGSDTVLAVEISDSSVSFDLGRKQRLYARHEIPEYWVADVTARRLVRMWSPLAKLTPSATSGRSAKRSRALHCRACGSRHRGFAVSRGLLTAPGSTAGLPCSRAR